MRVKKDMLKQWKADFEAIQEEKEGRKEKRKRIKNIIFRVIQLTLWIEKIRIIKRTGYGSKRRNKYGGRFNGYRWMKEWRMQEYISVVGYFRWKVSCAFFNLLNRNGRKKNEYHLVRYMSGYKHMQCINFTVDSSSICIMNFNLVFYTN